MSLPKMLVPSVRNLRILPPVINVINCVASEFASVTVVSYDLDRESYAANTELIQISSGKKYPVRFTERVVAKLSAYLFMLRYLFKNSKKFDFIWIGVWDYPHLDFFARLFGFKGKIIFHFHELEFEKLKYCRKADYCVVPEENRLWITYFLGKLQRKPLLLPNIPFLPFTEFEKAPEELISLKRAGKKIILYQGLIDFDKRCLNELLESLTLLPDWFCLVIMPMPSTDVSLLELLRRRIDDLNVSPKVMIIEPQLPPGHLNYIKYADVGIGLYRPLSLNQIYAAPNRLFEFTRFSVPVILPDFPAFKTLSSFYKYGIIAVNPESPNELSDVLMDVFEGNNMIEGRKNAQIFFEKNANYKMQVEKLWEIIKQDD